MSQSTVRSLFAVDYKPQDSLFVTEALTISLPDGNIAPALAQLDEKFGSGQWEITELRIQVYTNNPESGQIAANLITDALVSAVGQCTWVREWYTLYTPHSSMSVLLTFRGRIKQAE